MHNPILWGVFVLYIITTGFIMANHEPWGDEIHSWNIAKASGNFAELISNTRFEGHPPIWYTILWTISKFSHDISSVQLIHLIIACSIVFLILFYSPFSITSRLLLPFGYYFFYEYAILCRNYAIGVLLAILICLLIKKDHKYKIPIYYILLFLMSNTHLLALILAGCLHLYYLVMLKEQKNNPRKLFLHIIFGAIVMLPAVYFIFPPSDSNLNIGFWMDKWSTSNLKAFAQAPIRSFIPVPAWWEYNSWNTEFLLEEQGKYSWLRISNLITSLFILVYTLFFFRGNKKCLTLFASNLFLSFLIAVLVFPLTRERYAGFLFIGFIVAWWLYSYENPSTKKNKWFLYALLSLQMLGGILSGMKDMKHPFSNAYKVNQLLQKIPTNERAVTDYWALNAISAFTDKSFYCIDMGREMSFVLWGPDLATMLDKPNRYSSGIQHLFKNEGIKKVYMISTGSPETLFKLEPALPQSFHIIVTDKIEGAINKGGNLYLYEITSL
jgi:hypothetical protein